MDLHENVDGEEISEFAMAVINGTHPKYINSEPVPKYQDDKYLTVLVNHWNLESGCQFVSRDSYWFPRNICPYTHSKMVSTLWKGLSLKS